MRSLRAEQAVELMAIVDLLLDELPGYEIKVDGVRVDPEGARGLARRSAERLLCREIGDA